MQNFIMTPIGTIHTPFTDPEGMPIQPTGAANVEGRIIIRPEFEPGLADLDGFSHIHILYALHRCQGYSLSVVPYMDDTPRGLFATRAPRRPNPIGLSVVRLQSISGNELRIIGIDVLDGTPLLDIKPYVPRFDAPEATATGWLETKSGQDRTRRADSRFHD
ncbi:MAG: tRNA (N6-threonylcarbamoyladenosine(37)-N6)-methyltransferase TrmO [Deltaproteobacteria bacterium]|nr:tRNA (N6-threonylcarbamoyladenosine(37)-N6)-methyltransferase TrmO [Deltaproteobacteria bacterium]